MILKVVDSKFTGSEIYSEIELDLDVVPKKNRSSVKREVGEFLVEQTLLSLGDATTPVSKAPYKKSLSKSYKKEKMEAGRSGVADLEFSGDMKDSFKAIPTESGIRLGHFKKVEAAKSDGHNNFSGQSELPTRRYLPKKEESYKRDIAREVDRIIQDAVVSGKPVSESKLSAVESKPELWTLLRSTYEGLTRPEIVSAIYRNESFVDRLRVLGLLKWLK